MKAQFSKSNYRSDILLEDSARAEVEAGQRFAFGENWSRFLRHVDEDAVSSAEKSLRSLLGVDDLRGKRFLDAGSGSGLFSLAAFRLGANVTSFDFDPQSVACAQELRRRQLQNELGISSTSSRNGQAENQLAETDWEIKQGSVLDESFLNSLGEFDIVYSWGVLHHTGNMELACKLISKRVAPSGLLAIAIYNDQGAWSRYWTAVKRMYNRSMILRIPLLIWHAPYLGFGRWLVRKIKHKGKLDRGMSIWHDMLDWLGGYPFEVATPAAMQQRYEEDGFELIRINDVGKRMGCNEFVFRRKS